MQTVVRSGITERSVSLLCFTVLSYFVYSVCCAVVVVVVGVAFRGLPDVKLYPAVSAVYGNTEVSMVYLGCPLDG